MARGKKSAHRHAGGKRVRKDELDLQDLPDFETLAQEMPEFAELLSNKALSKRDIQRRRDAANSEDEDSEVEADRDDLEAEIRALRRANSKAKASINLKDEMTRILDEIELPLAHTPVEGGEVAVKVPWVEAPVITSPENMEAALENVHNDYQRELLFYVQAEKAVAQAFTYFKHAGIPVERPDDYYAEMMKSDHHMNRVKDRLLKQDREMHRSQERTKARKAKKFGKQVQTQKLQERASRKKDALEAIKQFRKRSSTSDTPFGFDPAIMDAPVPVNRGKRVAKDKRYGYGDKSNSKTRRNDSDSAADMSSYRSGAVRRSQARGEYKRKGSHQRR